MSWGFRKKPNEMGSMEHTSGLLIRSLSRRCPRVVIDLLTPQESRAIRLATVKKYENFYPVFPRGLLDLYRQTSWLAGEDLAAKETEVKSVLSTGQWLGHFSEPYYVFGVEPKPCDLSSVLEVAEELNNEGRELLNLEEVVAYLTGELTKADGKMEKLPILIHSTLIHVIGDEGANWLVIGRDSLKPIISRKHDAPSYLLNQQCHMILSAADRRCFLSP